MTRPQRIAVRAAIFISGWAAMLVANVVVEHHWGLDIDVETGWWSCLLWVAMFPSAWPVWGSR